mgnify:CR=1 FL=1
MNLLSFVDRELFEIYQKVFLQSQSIPMTLKLNFNNTKNKSLQDSLLLNFYFDHTYVLNLTRRPDRLNAMSTNLKKIGFYNWSRWEALDGKESPHYDEYIAYRRSRMTYNEKRKYHRKAIGSCGSWAILKSMYLMLKNAIKNKYQTILVLQDDLLWHKNFVKEFLTIPDRVPKNWKLLYLGATQHNWNHVEQRPFYYFPMGTADGAFAVGIHHSIFQEMMDEILQFDMPFDSGPLKRIQKKYGRQAIILKPNLVIADIRDSDLRKSRNLEAHAKKFGWNINLYKVPPKLPLA